MTGPSRRDVLKGVAGATGGGVGLAATSTGVSARGTVGTRGGEGERAWSIPQDERDRRMDLIPISGRAVRKTWRGNAPARLGDGMYAYVGSINRDDLCYWHGSGCLYAAVGGTVSGALFGPKGALVGGSAAGLFCGLGKAGCRVLDDVEKAYHVNTEWVDVYGLAGPWWFTMTTSMPKWFLKIAVTER